MEPLSAGTIAGLTLNVIDNALELGLKLVPGYDQKKVEQYHQLRKRYEEEYNKPRGEVVEGRSNRTLLNLRDECVRYGATIIADLRQRQG